MSKLPFKPIPSKKEIVYLLPQNNLGAVYGACVALKHLSKLTDLPYEYTLAVHNVYQKSLVNHYSWLTRKAELFDDLGSDQKVVDISPSPKTVGQYITEDLQKDYEVQSTKNSHVDPERFRLKPFPYSSVMYTARDVLSMVNMATLSRPLDLLPMCQNIESIFGETVRDLSINIIADTLGTLNDPFMVIEKGFADCADPKKWFSNCIVLPTLEEFELLPLSTQMGYFGLMEDPMCSCVGLCSKDWIPVGIAASKKNPFIVWDVDVSDPDSAAMAYHIPQSLATVISMGRTNPGVIPDMVFSLQSYHDVVSKSIQETDKRPDLYKPIRNINLSIPWIESIPYKTSMKEE